MDPTGMLPAFDRAGHLRKDTERLMRSLDDPRTVLVPVWKGQAIVRRPPAAGGPDPSTVGGALRAALPTVERAARLVDQASEIVWLGLLGDADCFAIDLSELSGIEAAPELGAGAEAADLRAVGSAMAMDEAGLLAYARGMLHWHETHRYCGRCGAETRPRAGGHERECTRDGQKHFPRTDPAIMALVSHGDRCLLARQKRWPKGMYSVLAGFVEPGESLEEAVLREVMEEVGLPLKPPSYLRSQPWPFPASLMVGFSAEALSETINLDMDEIEEARWFSRGELASPEGFFYPPPFSLAHHLIQRFLERAS